jgi:enamine deaminase RidA (YjgF/YER057c/UK114 family)/catechol 2,3-dioxygenase-like lactoylglutathione lyase family enzyme
MTAQEKLDELGITLPAPPAAVAAYEPWVRTGNQVVTSGQLPWFGNQLAFTGKLGSDLTVEQGYQAARLCAINAIAQLKAATGDLERIRQIVRLEGNVQAAAGFQEHPQVLNGASDLMNEVFGDRGRHTRTALGINEMPLNAPVQLSVYAEVSGTFGEVGSGNQSALAHCTLATRDVPQTRRFFQETFGWQPIERPGNIECEAAWLRISPGQELHLLHVPDFEASPFEREFGRHVAVTFPLAEFERLKTRLVERGAELIEPGRETPFERFFFRDPNGYVFEVVDSAAVVS